MESQKLTINSINYILSRDINFTCVIKLNLNIVFTSIRIKKKKKSLTKNYLKHAEHPVFIFELVSLDGAAH